MSRRAEAIAGEHRRRVRGRDPAKDVEKAARAAPTQPVFPQRSGSANMGQNTIKQSARSALFKDNAKLAWWDLNDGEIAVATSAQTGFPPGGITPVFNEITAMLTMSPTRPDPDVQFDQLTGPKDRVVMKNVIDESGIVLPTIFVRSDTFKDPNTHMTSQVLSLAACSAVGTSRLLGGEVAVHVKSVSDLPGMTPALPPGALHALDMPLIGGRAVTPKQASIGKIQALSPDKDFPARVTIPVYYSLVLGVRDGKLAHVSENVSVEGKEPHFMEAVVDSIPPDPHTVLRGREWDLVTDGFVKLWVKIESFRFLGLADWTRRERVEFHG